jgi:hypothetical protein
MPCPPHWSWLYLPNDIWGWVQIMKDFKFSRRRVWCSELSSGLYCCTRQYNPEDSSGQIMKLLIVQLPPFSCYFITLRFKYSSTQDNTTQKGEDKHPCLKQDSNPRSQRPSDQGLRLRPRGNWDRPVKLPDLEIERVTGPMSCEEYWQTCPFQFQFLTLD